MTSNNKVYVNGIHGITGEYLIPPLNYSQVARFIKGEHQDTRRINWLKRMWRRISQPHLGLPYDVNATDITQAGWGVVFYTNEDKTIKDALSPLIEHRRQMINDDNKVKILAYRNGEDSIHWLARHRVGLGSIDPTKVPYYLLLIGSPEHIPFDFGHHLGIDYAVGRLHFDTPSEYSNYVASLIHYEAGQVLPNAKEAIFFGTRHSLDSATELSADLLVNPLAEGERLTQSRRLLSHAGFSIRKILGRDATKDALSETLAPAKGAKPPAFLFTATHGIGLPASDARQCSVNGALLCQDWPGFGTVKPDHYFTGSDIPSSSRISGMITFHFACYGAGTPSHDRFFHESGNTPDRIANQPFIAALPKALLAHSQGGALASVGHIERAWSSSFKGRNDVSQLQPFQNAIGRILSGEPIGYAMKDFGARYALLSTHLSSLLEKLSFDSSAVSDEELFMIWIERNDAESYIIIGDPFVRLGVDDLQ